MGGTLKYLAHITERNGNRIEQSIKNHCIETAEIAATSMKTAGFYNTAYLAGILHDTGKYSQKYQNYLEDSFSGKPVIRGSVTHTFTGVIYLYERYHTEQRSFETMTCEIICYAIGGHHGEFDVINSEKNNGFIHRLNANRDEIQYEEAINAFSQECIDENGIDELFEKSVKEIETFYNRFKDECVSKQKTSSIDYALGLLTRMILSAVIYGDRTSTANFMRADNMAKSFHPTVKWKEQLDFFEKKLGAFNDDTLINHQRNMISEKCKEFAKHDNGIYRLSVPTGAGKTLSTLRFALTQAERCNKKKIIFIIPLLSILDQNAKVIKEYILDKNILTEHHSNVIMEEDNGERLDRRQLTAEMWESPIIISTLYQLLMMLFSNKTSAIARMRALSDSIIVIDEAQSIPHKVICMFNEAANFLTYYFNTTLVLSSATQPTYENSLYPMRFDNNADMIADDKQMLEVFKRTEIIDCASTKDMSLEELVDFNIEQIENKTSVLTICNTKSEAKELFNRLKLYKDEYGYELFHLSTSMCMKHRQDTLKEIIECLDARPRRKMICISTQLVEAGIDFSFECVIRVIAGMDNLVQSAGRCNRNNEYGHICKVFLVRLRNEQLTHLDDIKMEQNCTLYLLDKYKENPEVFDNDLLSSKSIKEYYKRFFSEIRNKQIDLYKTKNGNLFELLSSNTAYRTGMKDEKPHFLKQAFLEAGKEFTVYDKNTQDVIVPYSADAKNLICELCSSRIKYDLSYAKKLIKNAKPYTIQLFTYQIEKLQNQGMIHVEEYFMHLESQCYKSETGLEIDNYIL